MDWSVSFVTAALIYSGYRFLKLYFSTKSSKYMTFSLAAFCYMFSSAYWVVPLTGINPSAIIHVYNVLDLFQVSGVALILCSLSIENWEDRPPIARYPYLLSYLPLLLIPAFLMVYDTVYYKELMTAIYESAAILIALILYGLMNVRNFNYVYIMLGTIILLLAFAVHWFPGGAVNQWPFIWNLITTTGVLFFIRGYVYLQKKKNLEEVPEF